jgi:hypothetical protein
MPRLPLPRRIRELTLALVGAAIVTGLARAAEPTTYLPDGTMLVLTLNVKQLRQSALLRGDEKAFKEKMAEAAKALETFGVDPAKDLDRIVLAVGEQLNPANTLILIEGRFDVTKIQGRLRELTRERKNDLQAIEESGFTIFQGRLPKPAVANPTVPLPERFVMTILDGATIALAADRAALTEAVAKKAGRTTVIKPRVAELVGKVNPQETLSVVFVPPADFLTGPAAGGLNTVTGGLTVSDGVTTDIKFDMKDAETAKRLAGEISDGVTRIKDLLPGLAAFQPGVGRKDQEMIKDMLDTFKIAAKPDSIQVTSTISKELIEKNARKDQ